jgi:2-keto-4-pentenoate hydratase/2-oxohepta-3-ene-1,7-dioic acid hydratase in catechol pathway
MKICRVINKSFARPRYALVEDSTLRLLDESKLFEQIILSRDDDSLTLEQVELLAPVTPSKVVCVGRNYREHAAELGNKMPEEPLLFLKPPSSVIATNDRVELPPQSQQVEHEGELGVVIGRTARKLSETDDALSYVFGYTCINDVTARDLQRKDSQWTRAKGFDTFCPVGPRVASGFDWRTAEVRCRVNGVERQRGRADEMQFQIPFLLAYISSIMTLEPGDLVATGTPAGVGPLRDGDVVEVEIPGVGILSNPVKTDNHR